MTRPLAVTAMRQRTNEAWYHADFCHAFAWVYEDGDRLRVRWSERTGSDLYLHSRSECERCREIRRDEHKARDGEFTMEKPSAEFSSHVSFFRVLAEIAKYVPGLLDDDEIGAGEGSRPSLPVAPDGPDAALPSGEKKPQ